MDIIELNKNEISAISGDVSGGGVIMSICTLLGGLGAILWITTAETAASYEKQTNVRATIQCCCIALPVLFFNLTFAIIGAFIDRSSEVKIDHTETDL